MKCESISFCLFLLLSAVKSYPVKGIDSTNKEYKNEMRFPNGTVVGKYTYKDKDGNAILVKYFADDSTYGVELKSAKVIDANSDNLIQYKLPKISNINTISTVDMFQPLEEMTNALLNKELNKNKTYNPLQVSSYYPNKINRYKDTNKAKDDYEIFSENDLKPTAECNKEKVKVYLDKNKRKTRNAPYHYQPSDYCERF